MLELAADQLPAPSHPPVPRHQARATRDGGRRTRSALIDAATRLFAERGLQDVSLSDIAAAADAFPSQVTYYFGSKEALFVEAASREVLHLAQRVERAGRPARSRTAYARAMVRTALVSPALVAFGEALLLARQRPALAPLVDRTLRRLQSEGARAWSDMCSRRRWPVQAPAEDVARGFWAVLLGLALEQAGSGRAFDREVATTSVLAVLDGPYSSSMTRTPTRRS